MSQLLLSEFNIFKVGLPNFQMTESGHMCDDEMSDVTDLTDIAPLSLSSGNFWSNLAFQLLRHLNKILYSCWGVILRVFNLLVLR